jgi:hypothetical protein
MSVIRTTRFSADPADAGTVLERRGRLLDAVRKAFDGPAEARLVRVDEQTWLDIWRWDSAETLAAAIEGAHHMPEAAAAFALTRDVTGEQGEVVAEDRWPG